MAVVKWGYLPLAVPWWIEAVQFTVTQSICQEHGVCYDDPATYASI